MSMLTDRKAPVHGTNAQPNGHATARPDARVNTPKPGLTRQPTAEERRRAQRVMLRMRVVVNTAGKTPQEGFTHTVSQNGAMILMPEPLAEGAKVLLENPKTNLQVEARVVRPPQITSDGSLVPVEFLTPSPHFWNVFFPPTVN